MIDYSVVGLLNMRGRLAGWELGRGWMGNGRGGGLE